MIIKIDDRKIKHQPNTEMFFWDRDNLLKRETKPIMKLNSQLTQYLMMKSKNIIKKEKNSNSLDLRTKSTNQICEQVHELYKV